MWGLLTGHVFLDVLKMQVDNNPVFVYIPTLGGLMFVLYTSKWMSLSLGGGKISHLINKNLACFGRNSFYIFAAHHPFIRFMDSVFSVD